MRKITKTFALTLVLMLVLASCKKAEIGKIVYEDGGNNLEKTAERSPISLVLGEEETNKHTGIFVSLVQDHFRNYGLSLNVTTKGEKPVLELISEGAMDLGMCSQAELSKYMVEGKDDKIVAIASIAQHNTLAIFSKKEANISSLKDLEGKKMIEPSPVQKEILKALMAEKGADFSSINFVKDENFDPFANLVTDSADAVLAFYEQVEPQSRMFSVEMIYMALDKLNPSLDYYDHIIVANKDFLDSNKDKVEGFLAAIDKGYNYAVVNPAISTLSIDDYIENSDREILAEAQVYLSQFYLDENAEFGRIDKEKWDSFNKWLFDNKIISKELPSAEGFTNEYLLD